MYKFYQWLYTLKAITLILIRIVSKLGLFHAKERPNGALEQLKKVRNL